MVFPFRSYMSIFIAIWRTKWRIWRKLSVPRVLKPLCPKPLLVHRLHRGEEQHIADGSIVGHQHDHAVDADAQAACGRHAVLEGVDVVLVHLGGHDTLSVAQLDLLLKTLALVDGVVEFGESVAL